MSWQTVVRPSTSTFLDSQGLNDEFGQLSYNDFFYDDDASTYDYRVDGARVDRDKWTKIKAPEANWTAEVVTS